MRVLVVNAGSSSLKLSVLDGAETIAECQLGRPGDSGTDSGLATFVREQTGLDAAGHRIVHGGAALTDTTVVTARVREELDRAAEIAPLHVPPALAALDAVAALIPVPQVACFDTAFHRTLPEVARTYAIPATWRDTGIRRYGFHGLSFAWSVRRSAELLERQPGDLNLVIAHVGSGVSVCAVTGGRSVDTTMGFTPAEGAVMATRSGSIDPGAIAWMADRENLTGTQLSQALERDSGWNALAGTSDMRDIWRRADSGEAAATLARDVAVRSVAQQIGAMATALDRVDALTFTGGIGSNLAPFRVRVAGRLRALGLATATPDGGVGDAVLTPRSGAPQILSVLAREDIEIAHEVARVLG